MEYLHNDPLNFLQPNVAEAVTAILHEHQQHVVERLIEKGFQPSRSILFSGETRVTKQIAAHAIAQTLDLPVLDFTHPIKPDLEKVSGNNYLVILGEDDVFRKCNVQDASSQGSGMYVYMAPGVPDHAMVSLFDAHIAFETPSHAVLKQAAVIGLNSAEGASDPMLDLVAKVFEGQDLDMVARFCRQVLRRQIVVQSSLDDAIEFVLMNMPACKPSPYRRMELMQQRIDELSKERDQLLQQLRKKPSPDAAIDKDEYPYGLEPEDD